MSKLTNYGDRPPSTPRWVKLSGIIVIILVLMIVIMKFIVGGDHGPGRHTYEVEPAEKIEHNIDEGHLLNVGDH